MAGIRTANGRIFEEGEGEVSHLTLAVMRSGRTFWMAAGHRGLNRLVGWRADEKRGRATLAPAVQVGGQRRGGGGWIVPLEMVGRAKPVGNRRSASAGGCG